MRVPFEPVAAGSIGIIGLVIASLIILPYSLISKALGLAILCFSLVLMCRDRWSCVRLHPWPVVRHVYQALWIYHFIWRLSRAYNALTPPVDALGLYPNASELLDRILATGPETFQQKPTNRAQIESLMECVCGLVRNVKQTGKTPIVLDIGAGKALLTRAIYEALDREVAAVALDNRHENIRDLFYDPPRQDEELVVRDDYKSDVNNRPVGEGEAPYSRIVADVRHLAARTLVPLSEAKGGGVVAITKHLCGGATDGSLMALCAKPLNRFVGACCLAPCCHQKTAKKQYCNIPFLESLGFCKTHIGKRGGVEDIDFRTLMMIISMSRHHKLLNFEYKKSVLLELLGFSWASELGRQARHLIEAGRIDYLRSHGYDAHLVRYCSREITGDNLAIIARRRTVVSKEERQTGPANLHGRGRGGGKEE